MILSERRALAALAAAAAMAGSAGVHVLDAYGVLPILTLQYQRVAEPVSAQPDGESSATGAPISTRSLPNLPLRLAYGTSPRAPQLRGHADDARLQDRLPQAEAPGADASDAETQQAEPLEAEALEAETPEADALEAENPDTWSSQTRREAKADPVLPAVAPQAAAPLPWTSAASSAPARTYTLAERVAELSPAANKRLAEKFEAAKAVWPPAELTLVAIKDQKVLELFARSNGGEWTFVHRYKVLAASGTSGPKLRQGDKQVPEGVYGISFLNPNSRYHVSMRVDYPNAFDRKMAGKDGRKKLGGDIMIHGKNASIGCLAIGDEAAEEVFVLAANIGLPKVKLIIAPTDFRRDGVPAPQEGQPAWVPKLYTEVASAMEPFKAPPEPSLLSYILGK